MQNNSSQPWIVDQYERERMERNPYPQQPPRDEHNSTYNHQAPGWHHRGHSYSVDPSPREHSAAYEEPRSAVQGNFNPFHGYNIQQVHAPAAPQQEYGGPPPPSDRYPDQPAVIGMHNPPMASRIGNVNADWSGAIQPIEMAASRGQRQVDPIAQQGQWTGAVPPAAVPRSQYADVAMLAPLQDAAAHVIGTPGHDHQQRQMSSHIPKPAAAAVATGPTLPERPYRKASIRDLMNPVLEQAFSPGSEAGSMASPASSCGAYSDDLYGLPTSFPRRGSAPPAAVSGAMSSTGIGASMLDHGQSVADVSKRKGESIFHVTRVESHYSYAAAPPPTSAPAPAPAPALIYVPVTASAAGPPTPCQLSSQYVYSAHPPRSYFSSVPPTSTYVPSSGQATCSYSPQYGHRREASAPSNIATSSTTEAPPPATTSSAATTCYRPPSSPPSGYEQVQERPSSYQVCDSGIMWEVSGRKQGGDEHSLNIMTYSGPAPKPSNSRPSASGMGKAKPAGETKRKRGASKSAPASRSMPDLHLIQPGTGTPNPPSMTGPDVESGEHPIPVSHVQGVEAQLHRDGAQASSPEGSNTGTSEPGVAPLVQDMDVVMEDAPSRSPGLPLKDLALVDRDVKTMSRREAESWRLQRPQEIPRRSRSVEPRRNPLQWPAEALAKGKMKADNAEMTCFSEEELETSRILTNMSKGVYTVEQRASKSPVQSILDHDRTVSASPSPRLQPKQDVTELADCAKALKCYSRSLFMVGNGPKIQNHLADLGDSIMFICTEMMRIESRFTPQAMQEWISKHDKTEEYLIIPQITKSLNKALDDKQPAKEFPGAVQIVRELLNNYIYNGRLGKWLKEMERELTKISEEQARGNSQVQEAQRQRAAEHRVRKFRLPDEAAGNFFGSGLA